MNNLELLRLYKLQNPDKYLHKFGDVTPEEAAEKLKPNNPFSLNGVKFELSEKKEKEMEFKEVIMDPVGGQVASVVPEAPIVPEAPVKRTRKPKTPVDN